MKSYITSIGTANPAHVVNQEHAARFMCDVLELSYDESRKLKALYRSSGIDTRYTVMKDYILPFEEYTFFPKQKNLEPFPGISKRMQLYKDNALPLAIKAIYNTGLTNAELFNLTHIITVSCTGMYAPGLDIEIIHQLNLSTNIQRQAINFMGCYAAFNALKAADAICKSYHDAKVLIVSVELCSIHFQKHLSLDHLVSNAIFSDGAAAVMVEPKASPLKTCLSLESFFCDLAFEGKGDMAWHIADHGFEMTLSSYVPELLKTGIGKLAGSLFSNLDILPEDISLFAIHPGGRKILEALEQVLGISKQQNKYAYDVLKSYGNMSSATVLFVLQQILSNANEESKDKNILSLAFGPGLTIESMVLKVTLPEVNKKLQVAEMVAVA